MGLDGAAVVITMWSGWCLACGFLVRYDRDCAPWCGCSIVHIPNPELDARHKAFQREWAELAARRRERQEGALDDPPGALMVCAQAP